MMDPDGILQDGINSQAVFSFVLYLLVVVAIGVYASKFSSRGISEYFIGGRKINRYVIALSAVKAGFHGDGRWKMEEKSWKVYPVE